MTTHKIPKGALRFVEGQAAAVCFVEDKDKPPKMRMVAYSGGIIKDHWYWGNLAIDLKGMSFPESKYPVLENHDKSRKIAFTGKPIVSDKLELNSNTTKFVDTEESREFQRLSQEGFPYQSSIYAIPTSVERLSEDASAEVNGFKLKGPGTIWRKCIFKEASVCVFGYDSNTQSSAFSKDETEEMGYEEIQIGNKKLNREEVTVNMKTLEELKKECPELVEKFEKETEAKFSTEITELKKVIDAKNSDNDKLSERMDIADAKLDKERTIRIAKELAVQASKIWTAKLDKSDIPDIFHAKVIAILPYTKFVTDDKLDVEAFTAKIESEIKSWEESGITTSVLGSGGGGKEDLETESKLAEKQDKEDEDIADNLLKLAGQPQNK